MPSKERAQSPNTTTQQVSQNGDGRNRIDPTATIRPQVQRAPDHLHPGDILRMQHTVGNRAVQRLLAGQGQRPASETRASAQQPEPLHASQHALPKQDHLVSTAAANSAQPAVLQRTPLDNGEKDDVVILFGLPDRTHVPATVHKEHLPTLRAMAVTLTNYVQNDKARLNGLVLALAKPNEFAAINTARMNQRAQAIIDWNTFMGGNDAVLPGVTPDNAATVLSAITPMANNAGLRAYVTSQGLAALIGIINASHLRHLGTINTLMNAGGRAGAITAQALDRIEIVLGVAPPNSAYAQMVWGAGGEADPATNKLVHFRKHVLKIGNVDDSEPWKWVQILHMNITEADYMTWSGGTSWSTVRPDLFPQPTNQLTNEAQSRYFFDTFLPGNVAAQDALKNSYHDTYTNLIEANSGAMNIVTSDGQDVIKIMGNVNIGGFMVFIIGKLADDNSAFTISSAYAPQNDKLAANLVRKLYTLV